MFDIYTARNHKQLVRDAIARAQRDLTELDAHERNLIRPDGYARFSPPEEADQRLRIEAKRQVVLAERDQVIANAREVAENGQRERQAQIARIAALQENPIARLKAADAANIRHLVALWEDGFGRSSARDIWAQVHAVTLGSDTDQQIAVCEVLQRRIAALDAAVPNGQQRSGTQLEERVQLDKAATTLVMKLQDPGLAHERGEHAEALKAAEELLADVRVQDHSIRVEEDRETMRASGKYDSMGGPNDGPSVFRNMNEAPIYEFVEQA